MTPATGAGVALADETGWDLKPMTVKQQMAAEQERKFQDLDKMTLAAIADREYERLVAERKGEGLRVLKKGNPFQYFIDTFTLDHEGDHTAARCMALVFASSAVANGDGLHCYLSGSSGKGKSHAADTMFKQLPDEYRYNRTFSDKYLYYAGEDPTSGLKSGVVLLIDDHTMTEPVQELFKVAVTKYSDPDGLVYGTVQNQKPRTLRMAGRISWVLLKVDDVGDDQVMNRLIQARITETDEKIRDSAKKIQEKYRNLAKKNIKNDRSEIGICREMWKQIKSSMAAVEVPCAGNVVFTDHENLRNHELFFNLLMAHTLIFRMQRKEIGKTEDGIPVLLAEKADYKEAKMIFDALHTFGGQKHNTLKQEDAVVAALIEMQPFDGIFTVREVAGKAGISHMAAYRALHGRQNGKVVEKLGGLLEKCPFIQKAGKRGQYELEYETKTIDGYRGERTEMTRKESFNEDVYRVDLEGLKGWKNNIEAVKLTPGFKWEADLT